MFAPKVLILSNNILTYFTLLVTLVLSTHTWALSLMCTHQMSHKCHCAPTARKFKCCSSWALNETPSQKVKVAKFCSELLISDLAEDIFFYLKDYLLREVNSNDFRTNWVWRKNYFFISLFQKETKKLNKWVEKQVVKVIWIMITEIKSKCST